MKADSSIIVILACLPGDCGNRNHVVHIPPAHNKGAGRVVHPDSEDIAVREYVAFCYPVLLEVNRDIIELPLDEILELQLLRVNDNSRQCDDENGKRNKGKSQADIDKQERDMLAKMEAKKLVKTGILTAGNLVVQGISPCYQVVEGVYKNEEGNRLKSGAVAAVDATPLSYYKYGNDLVFKKGQVFKMNMIVEDDEEAPVLNEDDASGEVKVKEEKKVVADDEKPADEQPDDSSKD